MEESLNMISEPGCETEKPVDLNAVIHARFGMQDVDIRTYSPLALAYIGDGIYDLVIRTLVVGKGNTNPNHLHHQTSQMVKAAAQSEMMNVLLPLLTETETAVYKRGRNAKSATMAKNATVGDYRRATGFEALMGYLYLMGENERMLDLIAAGLEQLEAARQSLKNIQFSKPEEA